eukprot:GHVN01086610.1.p1 GENE.GHVN01086610.1~~GHVN01086610.1.p1  ORF type:complete len:197 (-),score=29.00 GHVN01086610.1:228-818(-)
MPEATEGKRRASDVDAHLSSSSPKRVHGSERWDSHTLNIAEAVMKSLEGESFKAISVMPVNALQGVGPETTKTLSELGFTTVKELAECRVYRLAKAMSVMEKLEKDGLRPKKSIMNLDKGVVTEMASKSITEILDSPITSIQIVANSPSFIALLEDLKIRNVRDLGCWKFCVWAEAICELAMWEEHEECLTCGRKD